jgi:hypothetical protein
LISMIEFETPSSPAESSICWRLYASIKHAEELFAAPFRTYQSDRCGWQVRLVILALGQWMPTQEEALDQERSTRLTKCSMVTSSSAGAAEAMKELAPRWRTVHCDGRGWGNGVEKISTGRLKICRSIVTGDERLTTRSHP